MRHFWHLRNYFAESFRKAAHVPKMLDPVQRQIAPEMHLVFYALQFGQSAFGAAVASIPVPPRFRRSRAVTEVYSRRFQSRAKVASGDLKKVPNLGDNKRVMYG